MSRAPAAVPTAAQRLDQLKLKTKNLEEEITSARGLNEQASVDSARARSRIRRMGEQVERESRDIDAEIEHLEWSVELASQERAKLMAMVDSANANLEATIAKYTQNVAQRKQEYAEQEALLKSELQMYNTELETLREFQSQRAQMEEELRRLDEELLRQRQVHQETMEQFRAQLKREQDHYERENRRRVREAEQAAVNIKDECLEAAAIRCIQDSQAVSHQLRKNQFKSRDILNANADLVKKIDSLKRENQLLTEREKMLIDDVAKFRQRIEAMKAKMAEDEVVYTKERARIETDSAAKIELLEKECNEVEKENAGLEKQIAFLRQRTEELEGQQRMGSNKQSQLMRLLTSTAPVVLDSLKSVDSEANEPAPLQALITKLNEALEEGQDRPAADAPAPKMVSTPVQTTNPNMKLLDGQSP
jgi:chromosome segregation ATPase